MLGAADCRRSVAAAAVARTSPRVLLHPALVPAPLPLASQLAASPVGHVRQEWDARWVTYFSKPDTDAWELHKRMNVLVGYDLVPERKITAGVQTLK